ncbi:hypothetical protein NUSPORA_01949 [Nucleospora cyclopteri]
MIFELLDFCLNCLNGTFLDCCSTFEKSTDGERIAFQAVSIYLIINGTATYKYSYILLQSLLIYSLVDKINKLLVSLIRFHVASSQLKAFLLGICSPLFIALLLSSFLYLLYQLTAMRKVSLASKFVYLASTPFTSHVLSFFVPAPDFLLFCTVDYFVYKLMLILCTPFLYKQSTLSAALMFSLGGAVVLAKCHESMIYREFNPITELKENEKYFIYGMIFIIGVILQLRKRKVN